jgi:hypothetical protein
VVFEVPLTVGAKVAVWPPMSDTLLGDNPILTVGVGLVTGFPAGFSTSAADAVFVESAWLVAVSVIVCCDETFVGAVYIPLTTDPRFGVSAQFTAVFVVPDTDAVNCADCPGFKVVEPGDKEIPTGTTGGDKTTVAVAIWEGSASLVAMMVTCVSVVTEEGA